MLDSLLALKRPPNDHNTHSRTPYLTDPSPSHRATPTLQHVLYADPSFTHANEVHLRLGLIHKVAGEFRAAYKRFQLVLNDSTDCTLSRHESKYCRRLQTWEWLSDG